VNKESWETTILATAAALVRGTYVPMFETALTKKQEREQAECDEAGRSAGVALKRALDEAVAEVRRLREENDTIKRALNLQALTLNSMLEEDIQSHEEIARLREIICAVAGSGVEFDDTRIRWLSVQIGRDTWERLTEASKR